MRANERFGKQDRRLGVEGCLLSVRACERLIEHQESAEEDEEDGSDEAREQPPADAMFRVTLD